MDRGDALRDALAFGAATAREVLRLGADRLRGGDPPREVGAITAGWLEGALAERLPGLRVRAVRALAQDAGTTTRARLALDCEGAEAPATLFVKLPPPDWPTRLFGGLAGLAEPEVRFFRELRDALPVRAPRCLHAVWRSPGRFALVLEDLVAAGARFRDIREPCSAGEAAAVLAQLAKLHGALWQSPRLRGDLAWLRAPGRHPGARVERFVRERLVAAGLSRHGGSLPADQRAAARDLGRRYRKLEDAWARAPRALLHGDPHLGNLWFDAGGPGLLDWQVVQTGCAFRDVAYFLVLSVDAATRRENERDLLRLYSDSLAKEGVAPVPPETAWLRYQRGAFYPWVAALATAGVPTLQQEEIQRTGVARSSAALADLDTLALLDAG